jgi:predicted O-methyltransferase YrrM
MSLGGTASYRRSTTSAVPDLVLQAVTRAEELGFELCVRPETGRLLATLAGGLPPGSIVGETGTGTGAGLAWMVDAADPTVRFVSFELDHERAAAAQEVFAGHANVEVVHGDAVGVFGHGPFDLLVLDGGPAAGKQPGSTPIDPNEVLRPGGTMTVDDFSPTDTWPPMFDGAPDSCRTHWLSHPGLRSTEVRVAADLAVVVCRYLRLSGAG